MVSMVSMVNRFGHIIIGSLTAFILRENFTRLSAKLT